MQPVVPILHFVGLPLRLRRALAWRIEPLLDRAQQAMRIPMDLIASDDLYARYAADMPWDRKRDIAYKFEMADGSVTEAFGVNGLRRVKDTQAFTLKGGRSIRSACCSR